MNQNNMKKTTLCSIGSINSLSQKSKGVMEIFRIKRNPVIIFFLLLTLLWGCTPNSQISINELSWIVGSREAIVEGNMIVEKWVKQNDTLLIGESYSVTEYDTILTETIQIIQKEETIYYVPLVFDQNEGKPIMFELKSNNPQKLVFENLGHDFPQKIGYYKKGKNINTWIEGNGKKIEFYFITI